MSIQEKIIQLKEILNVVLKLVNVIIEVFSEVSK